MLLLQRQLARAQWFSLGVLFVGVSLVQLQTGSSSGKTSNLEQNPLFGKFHWIQGIKFSYFVIQDSLRRVLHAPFRALLVYISKKFSKVLLLFPYGCEMFRWLCLQFPQVLEQQ